MIKRQKQQRNKCQIHQVKHILYTYSKYMHTLCNSFKTNFRTHSCYHSSCYYRTFWIDKQHCKRLKIAASSTALFAIWLNSDPLCNQWYNQTGASLLLVHKLIQTRSTLDKPQEMFSKTYSSFPCPTQHARKTLAIASQRADAFVHLVQVLCAVLRVQFNI